MKKVARKAVPKVIKSYSIVLFKKQLLKWKTCLTYYPFMEWNMMLFFWRWEKERLLFFNRHYYCKFFYFFAITYYFVLLCLILRSILSINSYRLDNYQ
jgi:hypothetical protein